MMIDLWIHQIIGGIREGGEEEFFLKKKIRPHRDRFLLSIRWTPHLLVEKQMTKKITKIKFELKIKNWGEKRF